MIRQESQPALSCRVSIIELFPPELFVDIDELKRQDFIVNSSKQRLDKLIEKTTRNYTDGSTNEFSAPIAITKISRQALSFMDIEKPAYDSHSTVSESGRWDCNEKQATT